MRPDPYEEPRRNLMVDIETLGSSVDSPIILSIAIVDMGIITDGMATRQRSLQEVLDLVGGYKTQEEKCSFWYGDELGQGDRFYAMKTTLSVDESVELGMKPESSTLHFWFNRPKNEQEEVLRALESGIPLRSAFDKVTDAINFSMSGSGKLPYIWARSPMFDLAHIRSAMSKVYKDKSEPWSIRKTRDMRTLEGIAGKEELSKEESESDSVVHDPFVDCVLQSKKVLRMLERVNGHS